LDVSNKSEIRDMMEHSIVPKDDDGGTLTIFRYNCHHEVSAVKKCLNGSMMLMNIMSNHIQRYYGN
jgi:hypothetical protein